MSWIKKGLLFKNSGTSNGSQLPVVDIYPDIYKIYYSARDNQNRSIPKYTNLNKSDLSIISDYPLNLSLGKPGSFDSHGIMPTEILTLEDGTKYLYYVGWSKRLDVPYWNSIGLATSKDDGRSWQKYSEGPIFSTSALEPNFIGTICVIPPHTKPKYEEIFTKPTWYMYYSSARWEEIDGKQESIYDIKSAVSVDGINWLPTGKTNVKLEGEEGGIAAFRKVKNNYYFSIRNKSDFRTNPENSYKIWCFNSIKNKKELILEPEGNETMCAYPFVIEEKDRDIMFYCDDFGKSGIYLAIKEK